VAELKGNISRAEVKTGSDGQALMSLEVDINDLAHLEEISKKISRLKDIYSVARE
jgi:(p)ppGpp synthase/HD superfamily hydrolase